MNNNMEIINLIEEIENIETIKVILLVENNKWLKENIHNFENMEEMQKMIILELSIDLIKRTVNDISKICWWEIYIYYNLNRNNTSFLKFF